MKTGLLAGLFSVLFSATVFAAPVLKINSSGRDVMLLQQKLQNVGYTIKDIDGIFGEETKRVVTQFQKDNNLRATGVVNNATWRALKDTKSIHHGSIKDKEALLERLKSTAPNYGPTVPNNKPILERSKVSSIISTAKSYIGVPYSFGGATTRLFLEILTNGCPEEVAAAKAAGVEPSPFFLGGKGGWVHSLTAIAAPHNGTTFIEANSDFTKLAADLTTAAAKALGLSSLKGVYDFQLDQFGIRKDDNETFAQALDRVLRSDFLSHNDNAFLDLTIDKSLEINKGIEIQPNVYYFSYAGDQTSTDPLTGNHYPTVSVIPSNGMCALMMPGSVNMGKYYDKYTAGGICIDQSWLPNDGLVNTVSALYPTTTDKNTTECLKRDGTQGWVNYDGYSDITFRPGIWYVMPVTRADHMQFVGGIANKSVIETHLFYRNLMDDIYSTYHTVQPTETPFPFTDVPESRWSYPYIKELYDAGVVSGTSATTFEPTAVVTRAQFVTMLAGLQGADVSAYTSGKFSDVPANAWYAPYVNWAADNGVVYGISDTEFAPDAEITRQDMAVMLYRYAGQFGIQLGTGNPAITFTDEADIAGYALPAVEARQRAGVISGMPDGSFRPRDTATREQACVMLCLL